MKKFSKISSFYQIYRRNLSSVPIKDVASLPKKIIEVLPFKSNPKPPLCRKPSIFIRALKFSNKMLVLASIYYYTASHGAWGTPEESHHFIKTICYGIKKICPYYITAFFWPDDKK